MRFVGKRCNDATQIKIRLCVSRLPHGLYLLFCCFGGTRELCARIVGPIAKIQYCVLACMRESYVSPLLFLR